MRYTTWIFFCGTDASHIFPSLYFRNWFLLKHSRFLLSNAGTNFKVLEILKTVLLLSYSKFIVNLYLQNGGKTQVLYQIAEFMSFVP